MVTTKPRIVIIGAGMAGLTAANELYKSAGSEDLFELSVVEGGTRIGGRINTSEFAGDRIEKGATWIHGIGGSPIHQIAEEINSLVSEQPWECMDNFPDEPAIVAEGGHKLNPSLVEPISNLFNKLMDFAQGKFTQDGVFSKDFEFCKFLAKSSDASVNGGPGRLSIGSFLRQGLNAYWGSREGREEVKLFDNWGLKQLEEAIFAMLENTQRTYTSAGDLNKLDFSAESEYQMFPGEEIAIAKGYSSIIESLVSVLPSGTIQLGKKVAKLDWQPDGCRATAMANGHSSRPVRLHFSDGSTMSADHVIVTVSLGVLKQGIREESGMFNPPLPSFKTKAISRLGFGVVNKLFLQLGQTNVQEDKIRRKFPFLQMAFHQSDPKLKHPEIPWWMRRTNSICPIYSKSSVVLSWFAGEEALEIESLSDEELINGVSATVSNFLPHEPRNGTVNPAEISSGREVKFASVLKTQWGSDPLFRGSYSYVAVGSSGEDFDTMAEPLPKLSSSASAASPPPLQILFAGEATHRTHYSTTHGAYFSGLREANRLIQHYKCGLVYKATQKL